MSTRTTRTTKRAHRTVVPELAPAEVHAKPSYARGNPLTHSVTFTDKTSTCWLVYVEPAPAEPALWPNAAVLPGRRLRFDSLDGSVTVAPFPAGAPFLNERALQSLLDRAQACGSVTASGPPRSRPVSVPDLTIEPVRDQLASVVSSRSGLTYRLSRMAQPFALVLMVIRDMIVPRGRG